MNQPHADTVQSGLTGRRQHKKCQPQSPENNITGLHQQINKVGAGQQTENRYGVRAEQLQIMLLQNLKPQEQSRLFFGINP